jgi:Protein of unknown function (DUF2865)
MRKQWQLAAGLVLMLGAAGLPATAGAGDFFSNLFGAFGMRPHAPRMMPPFADDGTPMEMSRPRVAYGGGGQAWCVRGCDGRYFPITGPDAQTKAASCNSFCPASKTELVYGSDIDHAATETGKPYSQLPNAFKYRSELVAGCTCNGKDQAGLAPVSIDNDPTLRQGDIVAGADGMMIANPGPGKHAELNFTPVPRSVRARFQRAPVVARE